MPGFVSWKVPSSRRFRKNTLAAGATTVRPLAAATATKIGPKVAVLPVGSVRNGSGERLRSAGLLAVGVQVKVLLGASKFMPAAIRARRHGYRIADGCIV